MTERAARWDEAARALSVVVPAALAAAHAESVPDAAHDFGVIRATGFGWTGAWRALDALADAVLGWIPVGTRALRGGLASAALAGIAGAVVYALARHAVLACRPDATRLGPAAAALGAASATLGVAWQLESASPGGAVLGALLALAPLALAAGAEKLDAARAAALGALVGLAASYEPLVGAAALASLLARFAVGARAAGARDAWRARARRAAPALVGLVGLAALAIPLAFAFARARASATLVLPRGAWASPLGEAGAGARVGALDLVRAELGWLVAALAVGGASRAALVGRARGLAAGLGAIALVGLGGVALGAPAGPTRWAGPALAAVAALGALAAVGMAEVVRAVDGARIPFARASAAMIVLLEAAIPARAADDAWARAEERRGAAEWDAAAWSTVPPGAIVLLRGGRALERIVAARASGAMRADVAVVPVDALGGRMASWEIAREPKLQPFLRDMALEGAPEELSLSSLASERPLVMTFDPRWEKSLARHLVPAGMLARFEPEPRGASDRRAALDLARPALARLESSAASAPRDPDACAAAASLLRARAVAWAAAGDRDMLARGLDELRPFAPDDPTASELARRAVTSKGGIDVKDL